MRATVITQKGGCNKGLMKRILTAALIALGALASNNGFTQGHRSVCNELFFVANPTDNRIMAYSSTGGEGAIFATDGIANPTGLAFGRDGFLYAANYYENTIVKIDRHGHTTLFANTGLNGPIG